MIEKIKNIKNLAVFQDFNWDNEVSENENNVKDFKKNNIIYGRNYSGKTTLSRIIRAMETGTISDKYENPEFCVKIKDAADVTQENLLAHDKTIRVFNKDFVKEKLKFINNPEETIQSFAILGDNVNLEAEIQELKNKLGSNTEGEKTKLYGELKLIQDAYDVAHSNLENRNSNFENQLRDKATNNPNGIRYNPEKYGDQNYDIRKLKREIRQVLADNYSAISNEEKQTLERVIEEKIKEPISELGDIFNKFDFFAEKAAGLITKPVSSANKIQELVNDAILNKWVEEGKTHHEGKREICAFCGNHITETRWTELEKHFDEESKKLERQIDLLLREISEFIQIVHNEIEVKKEQLYTSFHKEFNLLSDEYGILIQKYKASLEYLIIQLKNRKKDILHEKEFDLQENQEASIKELRNKFNDLIKQSNKYTGQLEQKQADAKNALRLREIHDFLKTIDYNHTLAEIERLRQQAESTKQNVRNKQAEIKGIIEQIETKQKLQKDERKGAEKVRELLSHYFGHQFLTIEAIQVKDEITGNKKYVFEIQRSGQKAYHLSEGEQSLIAFCYFMAKLQDVETINKKPIIWIDDPISSLDGNNVFFIYSLIRTLLFTESGATFEQLFISTHNLDFLKFLKRLPGLKNDPKKEHKRKYRHFIIERVGEKSTLKLMPSFLKDYVTEFNYLFKQIYLCSRIDEVTEKSYSVFYNFGNNARKFLEIYLYYKYPDNSSDNEKYSLFFGDSGIPSILTERINNEYSHLAGGLERGALPVDIPEMKKVAELIIEKIRTDENQYNAFLRSIGVEEDE